MNTELSCRQHSYESQCHLGSAIRAILIELALKVSFANLLHSLVHLAIGLKQQNEGVVEEHLLQVSDPSHHRHGKHLTAAEIQDIVRPSQESQDLVKSWLEEHGISGHHNPANDFIHVVIPIEKAEALLDTTYSKFQHEDGTVLDRAPEWSLPLHLHEHIDVVQPTTSFFRTKRSAVGSKLPMLDAPHYSDSWYKTKGPGHYGAPPGYGHGENGSSIGSGNGAGPISQICNISFTTPDCIRTLYGTYDYKPQVPGKNKSESSLKDYYFAYKISDSLT